MPSLLVAFSGGVDSTLLLAAAAEVLGDRVQAATVRAVVNPAGEVDEAAELARRLGVRHHIVDVDLLSDASVVANPPDRCYHCKQAVFGALRRLADGLGIEVIAHGEQADDAGDHRPGRRAASELGIRAPLAEAGLTKAEVRALSRQMGLPGWDRPSMACLASRIPYGDPLTAENLEQVARSESALREMGFAQVRVRHHGDLARIELASEDIAVTADPARREQIVGAVRAAGFTYVTLDLQGFRSGSMNEIL